MELITMLGVIGAAIILLAFTMNQINKWPSDSRTYDVVNTFGSLLLIVYAVLISSLPFIILNSVWFIVSLRDVLRKVD